MEVNDNLLMGFLEASPDAMLVVNNQRVILLANSQAESLFGYDKGKLTGRSLDILLPDSVRETHARHVEKFVQDPSKRRMGTGYDFTGQRSDGTQIQVEINLTHVDMGGEVVAVAAIRDVEPRRRAEAQLRKLMRAVEQSASMIIMCDPNGSIEYVNPKFSQVTGYASDEVLGKNPRLLKANPNTSDAHREMWDTLGSGHEWRGEFHNRKKNNETYWVSVSISPVLDAEGQIVHYIAVQEDITERKRIEEAERQQRALAEALRDTSAIINATLDVREVMDRILDHLGNILPYDTAELLLIEGNVACVEQSRGQNGYTAKQSGDFCIPLGQPSNLRVMIDTGRPMVIPNVRDYEHWITPSGGEWVQGHVGAPIKINDSVIGFLTLASRTDNFFTETHAGWLQAFADQAAIALTNARMYAELCSQASELSGRNRELDAFSHTVAHDLKSPLAGVVGYLGMLRDMESENLSDDGLMMLKQAESSAYHMKQIIESLLLLAQLRSLEQEVGAVDVAAVIKSALTRTSLILQTRNMTVTVDDDLPPVMAYGPWLEEVFANLITNAVKYAGRSNPNPTIHIYADDYNGQVRYIVADNGMGIAPEQQARLFEAFVRFHAEHAEGLGLGLSIIQRIIRKLGGEVGVESEPGKGSNFWFALPPA